MPTEIYHVIAADGSGDYTTLNAWNNDVRRDLVAADEIAVALIRGTIDMGTSRFIVTGSAWTTDADRYPVLRAESGQEAIGRIEGSGFAKITSSTTSEVVNLSIPHARIEDVLVVNTRVEDGGLAILCQSEGSMAVRCPSVFHSNRQDSTSTAAIRLNSSANTKALWCIGVNAGTGNSPCFSGSNASVGGHSYINCTAIGNETCPGFWHNTNTTNEADYPTAINCASFNCDIDFLENSGNFRWHADSRNNAGETSNAAAIPGDFSVTEITDNDIDSETGFSKTGGKLDDAGYNHGFGTLDIRRETITNWSIGVAVFGEAVPGIAISGNLVPGQKIIVLPSNDPEMTTGIRLTDQSSNTILLPLDYDAGEDEYSFDMPPLPAAGSSAQGVRFGSENITLTLEDLPE